MKNIPCMVLGLTLLVSCHKTIHEHPYEQMKPLRTVRVVLADATEPWRQYKRVDWAVSGEILTTDLGNVLCENEEEVALQDISGTLEIKAMSGDNHVIDCRETSLDKALFFDLLEGPYKMTAWADFRPEGDADWLWDSSNLSNVSLFPQRLPLEIELCEGFAASVDMVVTPPLEPADTMTVTLPLRRTMGRIRLVPDDIVKMRKLTGSYDRLMARLSYTQFVPTGFDAENHTTCFVISGYERHTLTSDDGTLTDLVLCPSGRELALHMSVTYFLPSGEEIGTVSGIPVPLWQGRETVVCGSLLTGGMPGVEGSGGMGIDESFEGENLVRLPKRKLNINPQ